MAQMDSTQEPGEQDANLVSSGIAVQQSSFDPDKFAKDLEARILAAVRDPREVQSLKDRTIAQIKKDKGLKEAFAELKAMQDQGLSEAEIQREIRIRELEDRLSPQSATPPQSPGKAVDRDANSMEVIISALGLDANDPDVTGILQGEDFAEKAMQLATLAQRRKKPANPAAIAQPAGGASSIGGKLSDREVNEKSAELNSLYKEPTKNAARIKKLEAELEPYWS